MTRPQVGDIIRFGEYGTAQASDVLSGKTIGTDDGVIEGTMPNNGIVTITPGALEQVLNGFYASGSKVLGDPNLVAENIVTGKSIFGVNGNCKPLKITIRQVRTNDTRKTFKKYTGSENDTSSGYIEITDLSFLPKIIISGDFVTSGSYQGGKVDGDISYYCPDECSVNNSLVYHYGDYYRVNYRDCYINSSGFCIPASLTETYELLIIGS